MLLQELLVKVAADITSYTQGMDAAVAKSASVEGAMDRMTKAMDRTFAGFDKLGSSLAMVGASMTAGITLPLAGVSVAALKVSSDLEQARIAFTTMMGSAAAAQKHLEALRDFAMRTPFEFTDLVQASKRLQALGFTAQQVIPTLTAIGDAAAALGSGSEGINRISLALGQMQAKGKVSAEEMRQLAEAGIPAWEMLAKAISATQGKTVTVAETMKMAEQGMINGVAAVQVLLTGMEGKFGGLMAKQMQTIGGMFSNLKDQAAKVLIDVGDALTPIGKKVVAGTTDALAVVGDLVTAFRKLPESTQAAAAGFLALTAAAGPALLVLGGAMKGIALIGTTIGQLAVPFTMLAKTVGEAMFAFSGMEGPLTAGATRMIAFGQAAVGVSAALLAFAQVKDVVASVAALSTALSNNISSWDAFKAKVSQVASEIGTATEVMFGVIGKQSESVAKALEGLIPSGVIGAFKLGMGALTSASKEASDSIVQTWNKISLWQTFKDAAGPIGAFNKLIRDLANSVEYFGGKYASMDEAVKKTAASMQQTILGQTHISTQALEDLARSRGIDTRSVQDKATAPSLINKPEVKQMTTEEAFSALGVVNLTENLARLKHAYDLVAASGKATPTQLAEAWDKVQMAVDAVTTSVNGMAMGPVKFFDPTSLPTLDSLTRTGAATKVAADAFKEYRESIQNAKEQLAAMIEEENRFRQNGFDPSQIKAGLMGNESVSAFKGDFTTIAQMQAVKDASAELDKQLANTANPFAPLTDAAEKFIETLNRIKPSTADLDGALRTLGVSMRDDVARVDEAWKTVQKAFADQKIGVEELNKSFIGYIETLDKAGVAIQDNLIAPYLRAVDAMSNARSKLHFAEEIKGEVSGAFQGIEAAIGQNLFEWEKWAGSIKSVAKNLVGDLATTFLHGLFKPLEQQFSTMVASWGTKIASSLGIFGSAAGSGGSLATLPLSAGNSLNNLGAFGSATLPAGTASTASSAATTATSSIMGTIGAIGSAASAISGIIGNFQTAGMNKSLDLIVKHTLQAANDLANLRRDAWDQHNGLIAKFDMIFDRLGDFWHDVVERLDNMYTRLGELVGGVAGVQTNADGSVTASSVFFTDLADAVRDGAKAVVDAIGTAADRITGVITAPPEAPAPTPETTPAPETQPYSNGIPYDTTVTKVTIPADQNTVNTLLLVNDTITKGFSATIAQLQSMGGLGGSGGGGTSAVTVEDPATLELMDQLKQQGVTVTTPTAGLSAEELQGAVNQIMSNMTPSAGSQASAMATIGPSTLSTGILTGAAGIAALQAEVRAAMDAGDAALANYYQQYIDAMQAPAEIVRSTMASFGADSTAAGTLTGASGLAELQRQARIARDSGDTATALYYQQWLNAAGGAPPASPGGAGVSGEGFWNGTAWMAMPPTIKPPEWQNPNDYNGSWNPVVTQNMQPAQNITITNNTFQSRDDINYLVNLVRNQL